MSEKTYDEMNKEERIAYLEDEIIQVLHQKLNQAKRQVYGNVSASKIVMDDTGETRNQAINDLSEVRGSVREKICEQLGIKSDELPKADGYEEIMQNLVKGKYAKLKRKPAYTGAF